MRGGRKDNPCSRSHAVKNNSSMKNSFDIFFKQDASTVFWNRAQNEFERFAAKPRGCKSFFKMVFNPQKWTCRPWLQTQSDWDTLYKKSSFTILFPTSSFPLNFTLMSYTDLLNSIRVNNFLLFLPVCIWIMPFTISSVWSTVQSHFPTLNTVSFSSQHEGACTSQWLHDLCQSESTCTGPKNTLEINATIYKGDNIISAPSPASMPSQEMLRADFTLWILQPGVSWMKGSSQHCLLERTVRQRYCQSIWMLPAALSLFEY